MQRSAVDSLLRVSQAYCAQLCDKQTLDHGIVYSCARFAELAECNQYREVIAETPPQLRAALAECDAAFDRVGARCRRWAFAHGRPTQAAEGFLEAANYHPHSEIAFALAEWRSEPPVPDVRVLPARAMRSALVTTFQEAADDPGTRAMFTEAALQRLDSPQLDMFVAICAGEPAGRCGLFQVGDLSEIVDLFVRPAFADRPVASALLGHVLTLARRVALRNVYARVSADNEKDRRLFERSGFAIAGEITEFVRVAPISSGAPAR